MSNKEEVVKTQRFRFQEGERILCFNGPLIYEAKCLKVRRNANNANEYLVHYAGWNKSLDEWATDLRILKYNEQNLARQKELARAYKDAKRLRGKSLPADCKEGKSLNDSKQNTENDNEQLATEEASCSNENQDVLTEDRARCSRRRKLADSVETEEEFVAKIEIKIKIPDELKPWLVDDWDLINRQRKLISLPAKNTVNNIIENYIKHKKCNKTPANKEDSAIQLANDLKEYFNTTLATQLLFKCERAQYSEIKTKNPGVEMSSIYGVEHLLRLFVIMGRILVYTTIDERMVQLLQARFQDFLKYLQKNSSNLFSAQHYESTTDEFESNSDLLSR